MISLRTHPLVVRAVLDDVAATNVHAAAQRAGLHPKTVYRWQQQRFDDPSWPSDQVVADYERAAEERGELRRRKAAVKRNWTKRVYLAGGPMLIDATGTVRRIQALYALGWTSTDLAPRLGVTNARVGHLASGRWARAHRDTAAKVAALYDELCMTVPQDPAVLPQHVVRVHDRQRRQSAAKGWLPPLAWDDIDDPNEDPRKNDHALSGEHWEDTVDEAVVLRVLDGGTRPRRLTHAEAVEVITVLRRRGLTTAQIEDRYGLKPERYYRVRDTPPTEEVA